MTQTTLFRAPTADGRMMYALDGPLLGIDFSTFAGAELIGPAEVIQRRGYSGQRFLIAPADATEVRYRRATGTRAITSWTRTRDVPAFPETIAAADWAAFAKPFGYDDDGDFTAQEFYRPEYAEQQYEELSIDLTSYRDFPVNVLDPESVDDPDETFTWEVAAAHLVFGEAFASAMPGALTGLRERIAKEVEALTPHAKVWTHKAREAVVEGSVSLVFEDKRTRAVKEGRKRVRHVAQSRDWSFSFPIPNTLTGSSKADAVRKYRALVDDIVRQIVSKKAAVCAACDGEGVVIVD
jgi:hypothetical protein